MAQVSAGTGGASSESPGYYPIGHPALPIPLAASHSILLPYSFGEEAPEENRVHLGHAIMSFYAALIDLLGRCAPEMHVRQGRPGWGGREGHGQQL